MKNVVFGIIASCVCLSASSFANGSGYNGPDLSPISIPVSLDRGISIPEIENAIAVCVLAGDPSHGLKSTMQGMVAQLGLKFPQINLKEITWSLDDSGNTHTLAFVSYLNIYENNFRGVYVYQAGGTHKLQVQLNIASAATLLETDEFFPFVTYGKILQDGGYDDYGNPDITKRIVSQLMIRVPGSFQDSGQAMPLRNMHTNVVSKFTVNAQEYVQCLQTELQTQANLSNDESKK